MKQRMTTVVAVAIGLLVSSPGTLRAQVTLPTSTGDVSTDLKNFARRFSAAMVFADVKTLGELLDDNFLDTDEQGRQITKKEFLASVKSGDRKTLSMAMGQLRIFGFGYGAVMTGRVNQKVTLGGQPTPEVSAFTDTFIMVNGIWKCIAMHRSAPYPTAATSSQATPAAPAAAPPK
jgi:hypothetical protein